MNQPIAEMDLHFVLGHLAISCYWQQLIDAGFENWEVLRDITEADMYAPTPGIYTTVLIQDV